MPKCNECGAAVPDGEEEIHAQESHADLCDEKLQDYISDSVNDAVSELFE